MTEPYKTKGIKDYTKQHNQISQIKISNIQIDMLTSDNIT